MADPSLSPSAKRALDAFGAQTGGGLSAQRRDDLWRSAVASTAPAARAVLFKVAAFGLSCALGAGVFVALTRPAVPEVVASPAAQWRQTAGAVVLELGSLRVRPRARASITVTTPQVQAVVGNAAALFEVTPGSTMLNVESGEVAWRAPGKNGRLGAGGRITVNGAAAALAVAPRGPPLESCGGKSDSAEYTGCLETTSHGRGLAAEAALFELGMLAHDRGEVTEAVARFEAYAQRFPDGALAPEASIALMVDLRRSGKLAGAANEAGRFAERFPHEPRAGEVARWAAQIP